MNKEIYQITPNKIDSSIKKFCRSITNSQLPFFVKVQPENKSIIDDCFNNVKNHIERNLSSQEVLGWSIKIWPKIMLEAVFHSIVKDDKGNYIDITPNLHNEKVILFLPDSLTKYEGFQLRTKKMALENREAILKYIEISDNIFNLINEGELKYKHGEINLNENQSKRYWDFLSKLQYYKSIIISETKWAANDLCPCGSGKKYKFCCQKT